MFAAATAQRLRNERGVDVAVLRLMIVSSGIAIDAPAQTVWSILVDLPRYAEWNPFIKRAWGSVELGGVVHVRVAALRGMPWLGFSATILEREDGRLLHWRGTFGGSWLGSGDHRFEIESIGEGRVRLTQSERFGGLLASVLGSRFAPQVRAGFDAMNLALATRAKRASAAADPGRARNEST